MEGGRLWVWGLHPFLVRMASTCPVIPLQETKQKMLGGLLGAETMAGPLLLRKCSHFL